MSRELDAALKVVERELGVKIRTRNVSELKQDPENARMHNDQNRGIIVESIKEVGAARSVVTDANDVTRAGNATIQAAQAAGVNEALEVETSGERLLVHKRGDIEGGRKAKRLALTDNAATDASEWDVERLAHELRNDEAIFVGIFGDDSETLRLIRALMEGEPEKREAGPTLADRFGVPPFSVLDARQGYWQDRKRAWLALGIESELGRGAQAGEKLTRSKTIQRLMPGADQTATRARKRSASPGGSPRPAAKLKGGKTQRGDGSGRAIKKAGD